MWGDRQCQLQREGRVMSTSTWVTGSNQPQHEQSTSMWAININGLLRPNWPQQKLSIASGALSVLLLSGLRLSGFQRSKYKVTVSNLTSEQALLNGLNQRSAHQHEWLAVSSSIWVITRSEQAKNIVSSLLMSLSDRRERNHLAPLLSEPLNTWPTKWFVFHIKLWTATAPPFLNGFPPDQKPKLALKSLYLPQHISTP